VLDFSCCITASSAATLKEDGGIAADRFNDNHGKKIWQTLRS